MTVYKDGNWTHDYTYQGNGCPGNYDSGGSITPCSSNLVNTKDTVPETQKIGTYYHFQAATSGSGGAIETNNANAPDSFCPLGWQLPYSGTGGDYYDKSKSWEYFTVAYGFTSHTLTNDGAKYPISQVFGGNNRWDTGRLYYFNQTAAYNTSTIHSASTSYRFIGNNMYRDDGNSKTYGQPIRCIGLLQLHRRHGGRNKR